MTSLQKAIKCVATAFAICLIVGIVGAIMSLLGLMDGFIENDAVTNEIKTYTVSQEITQLKVDINAGDFIITDGEYFSVESNLENLTVKDTDGVLTLAEKTKWTGGYNGAVLKIFVPTDFVFLKAEIETGAGKVTIDVLSADDITLNLGAGEVKIAQLNALQKIEIDGGAGKITISDGELNNLDFDMGVGECDLSAAILKNGKLDCGVGKTNITLKGLETDYCIKLDKGIGEAKIDGRSVSDGTVYGDGANKIEIDSGVGAVSVDFDESAQ